jgi:hypothetical protein
MRYLKATVGAYLIFMWLVGYVCMGITVYLAFEASVLFGLLVLPLMALPPFLVYKEI